MKLFLKYKDRTYDLYADGNKTIQELKVSYLKKLLNTEYKIYVAYQNQMLDDSECIEFYDIEENFQINVFIEFLSNVFPVSIEIITPNNEFKMRTYVSKMFTVEGLKSKIQHKNGIDKSDILLMFQNQLMNDNFLIRNYEINTKSKIYAFGKQVPDKIRLFLETDECNLKEISVKESDSILEVKTQIYNKFGWSNSNQVLRWNGVLLEDDKTVVIYKLEDNNIIDISVRSSNSIGITYSFNNRVYSLFVNTNEYIRDIKFRIAEKLKMESKSIVLKYSTILNDDSTIADIGIVENGNIFCERYPYTNVSHICTINYKQYAILENKSWEAHMENGDIIFYEGSESMTIVKVKEKIMEETGYDVEKLNVKFQGKLLEDDQTIQYYEIKQQDVINIVILDPLAAFEFYAKTWKDKIIKLKVPHNYLIDNIAEEIEEVMNCNSDYIKLEFKGEILDGNHLIEDYGIQRNSIINIRRFEL